MFKIQSEVLKNTVAQLVKSARRSGLGDKTLYIRTVGNKVSFYYHSVEISVEKLVQADIESELELATSIGELDPKTSALPDEIEITVEKVVEKGIGYMLFSWKGTAKRKSSLKVNILPESSPMLEVPKLDNKLSWKPNVLHNLVRYIPPFTLPKNDPKAGQLSSTLGPNFSKDKAGRVLVRATDTVKAVMIYPKAMEWFDTSLSIHTNSLQGVADVISANDEVHIGLSGGTVVIFKSGDTTAVCNTLVGNFPNIENYYNTQTNGKINIDRLQLIESCKRVKKLAPTAPILLARVVDQKLFAIVPDVLEQALPASVEGQVPAFGIAAEHLEMSALLYAMSKGSDELTLYVEDYNKAISIAIEGKDDIHMWCLPHVSQYVHSYNNSSTSKVETTSTK